jgi:SulP family sulfate permease
MSLRHLLPSRADYAGLPHSARRDLLAGLTVAVVALPLALAFGITTGLGAAAGLVTAIVAGLVAAVFGGSSVQVSGPTGAMTVVLVPVVQHQGAGAVPLVGLLAGLLILAAGVAGVGRLLAYFPWPVIEGFTVGIALIIALQQVPSALGVPKPHGDNAAVVAGRAALDYPRHGSIRALCITALVVLVMVTVGRVRRTLPASLIGVAVATAAAVALALPVTRIGTLPDRLPGPALPHLSTGHLHELFSAAVAVALLGALESLLAARVADGMADVPGYDPDRELVGQGMANVASSVFGGMPATGAIARTAVNVRAGARTRVAAITHSVVLVFVVLFAGPFVARIPLAALAGVLLVTAAKMIEVPNALAVLRSTRSDALVLLLTAAATVAFTLIAAVEIGLVAAGILALRKIAQSTVAVSEPVLERVSGEVEAALISRHIVAYRIDGALFFGAAQRFLAELTAVADVRVVILRLPALKMLDATGAQALGAIVGDLEHRGITVLLKGVRPDHLELLRAVGALDRLAHERHLFTTFDDAVAHAQEHALR